MAAAIGHTSWNSTINSQLLLFLTSFMLLKLPFAGKEAEQPDSCCIHCHNISGKVIFQLPSGGLNPQLTVCHPECGSNSSTRTLSGMLRLCGAVEVQEPRVLTAGSGPVLVIVLRTAVRFCVSLQAWGHICTGSVECRFIKSCHKKFHNFSSFQLMNTEARKPLLFQLKMIII